jgi:putative transposase
MSNRAHSQLYYHCVWATKNREPVILPGWQTRVYAYLWQKCINNALLPLAIGGMEDHLHVLIRARPDLAPFEVLHGMKGSSSHFVNQEKLTPCHFSWQEGYGVFSVSRSDVGRIVDYIHSQREHHAGNSCVEEWEKTDHDAAEDEFGDLLKEAQGQFG